METDTEVWNILEQTRDILSENRPTCRINVLSLAILLIDVPTIDKYIGGSTYKIFRRTPRPPPGPNYLVFTYIFTEKYPRQRSTPSKNGSTPPPVGNPGSATEISFSNECN